MSEAEKYEKLVDVVLGLADALEAAAVDTKHRVSEILGVKETAAVKEETFTILKFEPQKGERLGEYEVAFKANNVPDKWQPAHNILKQSNATIKDPYHGEDYAFRYWLYGEDKIYRKALKGPEAKPTPSAASTTTPSNIFPKDLVDLLSFEETKDWIIIKPRQFLGSENFSKIAAIVRDNKGDYVSAGKESHFRLPKTAAK